jgi:hypothetical protein
MKWSRLLIGLSPVLAAVAVASYGRAAPAAAPSIRVVSPSGMVTVPLNGKFPIQVSVSGIKLDMGAMGRKNVPGQGHYHFYVDCIPSAAYTRPNNFGGCWAGAVASERTVFDLSTSHVKITPGPHVLFLALAQNDHILYPAPPAAILFRVVKPSVSIQLLSPTRPVTVRPNGVIPIHVQVRGVTLDARAMGRKNVAGEGHYHFYVDCIPPAAYSRPNNFGNCWAGAVASERSYFDLSASHVKITPGTHVLLIALARNDHVLYRAPAADVVFTVR